MNMRKISFEACAACLLFLLLSLTGSCDRMGEPDAGSSGRLCVSFDYNVVEQTRSRTEIPDTSDFMLVVRDSGGKVYYEGLYGDCPESMELPAGSYVVKALSGTFDRPAFDAPQFGDEQCVVVPAGGRAGVRLKCVQMNAGVRLEVSPDFLTECPDAVLFLKSSSGKLMVSYSEKRTAYFQPGPVSLVMSENGGDKVLMTADLQAREILSVKVNVAKSSKSENNRITMDLDTSRVWKRESVVIGENQGSDVSQVLTVAQAMARVGAEDVWVSGYIVGGDLTSSKASFVPPFKSRTNIILGPRSSTSERDACLSVQLPEGQVRNALNLVDNPQMLRRRVRLKGDIVEPYFGMPGIKNIIDYQLY